MSDTTDNAVQQPPAPEPERCPPFVPSHLVRQLRIDTGLRWLTVGGVVVVLILAAAWEPMAPMISKVVMLAALLGWIALSATASGMWRQVPMITQLIEQAPDEAESLIAQGLAKRPLQRSLRVVLYHRLAMLRHRQRRYGEAAAISSTLLTQGLGATRNIEPGLLLVLADSCLESRDLVGAYHALTRLHQVRLGLNDSLQRMALQIRYEVASGQHDRALHALDRKMRMIELMAAPTCAAVHAMLYTSAASVDRPALAEWLERRARLLCTPEQFTTITAGVALHPSDSPEPAAPPITPESDGAPPA